MSLSLIDFNIRQQSSILPTQQQFPRLIKHFHSSIVLERKETSLDDFQIKATTTQRTSTYSQLPSQTDSTKRFPNEFPTFEQMPKQNKYHKKPKDLKRKQNSSNKVPDKLNFPQQIPK